MRTVLFWLSLCWLPNWLPAVDATPVGTVDPTDEPAAIARAYLATGDIAVLNRIFRTPMSKRGPAVDILLPQLVTTNDRTTLERAFTLLRCLDARRPETVAALRPFLAPNQPLQGHALCAFDALGSDGEPLIQELLTLLPSGNYFAAYALAKIGQHGELVVPALLAALRGPDGATRIGVIDALGNTAWAMQADLIVPKLTEILAAPEPPSGPNPYNGPQSLRGRAAYALSLFGWQAEPALPALLAALADDDRHARRGVLDALSTIGPSAVAALPRLIEIVRTIPRQRESDKSDQDNGKAVYALYMDRGNGFATLRTMEALGPLAVSATPVLVDLALADDEQLSLVAMSALTHIGGVSEADAVRLIAAGEMGGPRGSRFIDAIGEPNGAVLENLLTRWAAADGPLRELLGRGLHFHKTAPESSPALVALVRHQDPTIRRTVFDCLARGQPRPAWIANEIDAKLTATDSNEVTSALFAISSDPSRCAARIRELIALTANTATTDTITLAARAIGVAAPLNDSQVTMLRSLLGDPNPARHLGAARALATVLTADERGAAIDCALTVITTKDVWWQHIAEETLTALPAHPSAAGTIRHYFDHGDDRLRQRLLRGLVRQLPTGDGADLLTDLLDSPSSAMSHLACRLLAQHGPDGRRALPRLRSLARVREGEHIEDAKCAIVALDADDRAAVGQVAAQAWAWGAGRESRLMAIAALTAHPAMVPALHRLGELLSGNADVEIAAAGKALANRHH